VSPEEMAKWLYQNLTTASSSTTSSSSSSSMPPSIDPTIGSNLNSETKKEIAILELDQLLKKDEFSRQDTIRMQALMRESTGKPKGMYESLGGLLPDDYSNAESSSSSSSNKASPTIIDVPDIVVIGLQEIVELSAVGVVVDSLGDFGSKDTTKEWINIASSALALVTNN
jgi:hypothetical protein